MAAIVVKFYMKRELAITAFYHISIQMSSVKETYIKNLYQISKYYFFDNMINIKNLGPNNVKTDEKS